MNGKTRYELVKKSEEFPSVIRNLATTNPLIAQILEAYIHERILSKEEAYCQIIIGMNRNWNAMQKDYLRYVELCGAPFKFTD